MIDQTSSNSNSSSIFKNRYKTIAIFICGFLWGLTLTFILGILFLRQSLILEYPCEKNFNESVEQLVNTVKKHPSWEIKPVPCTLPQTQDKSRIAMFKICNAKYAAFLTNSLDARHSTAMIPCQIAIYEKEGKTYLARMNIKLFGILLGGVFQSVFAEQISPEQEQLIAPVIQH